MIHFDPGCVNYVVITIHPATTDDLPSINFVIKSAIMNWPLPDRLRKITVPVLQYREDDMAALSVLVAKLNGEILGIAAWDSEPTHPLPNGLGGLFHGLFVLPLVQYQGIGTSLMNAVFDEARKIRATGLLIKAQRVSRHYFERHNLPPLAATDDEYPWQYWKRLA